MQITKQMIEDRLEALKRDLQVLDQKSTAVQGAILDCEHWLQTVEKKKEDGKTNTN